MAPKWRTILTVGLSLLFFNLAVYLFLSSIYLNPDGIGYFSYLPAVFAQHTLSFAAVYEHFHLAMPAAVTPTGWLANIWAFGAAFLWLPFYAAARVYLASQGVNGIEPWGGIYFALINFGSMIFGALAMVLLLSILKGMGWSRRRGWVLGAAFFGTPLFFYSFLSGSVAHAATAFATGLYLWVWLRTLDEPSDPRRVRDRWFTLGLLAGIAAMVRTQEILVLMTAIIEWVTRTRKGAEARVLLLPSMGWMILGVLIGFSPRLWSGSSFTAGSSMRRRPLIFRGATLPWRNACFLPSTGWRSGRRCICWLLQA